ncbi:YihY/virulence factor BrkB family protein [Catenuloplanes atrovinosus]|uniref:YihY family inner membrane protein n=1 Tax=Catenuloplanes atrovinosus TaxID=137266 RepID=A0AAE3YH02_9ACTN|nr:YihY/virulence factor BrkB family protein [Catenuloplanes atrovinosus]MDR7273743.1 YihY family inner membrane protein [Catenuloplanes atrovinosus]
MSSTNQVPETRLMSGDELSADDAWHALRVYGRWHLFHDAFVRFRYGDGFSHSRALALQLCLAVVPFLIALAGLATDLGVEEGGLVVADTILALTPGASHDIVADLLTDDQRTEEAGELALALGLITGMVSLTQTMAQIERGANRIYGVERDRPALLKYVRAAVLAVLAGVPALFGFLTLVASRPFGDSIARRYPVWGDEFAAVWNVVRWPASLALVVFAVGVIFRYAPRRRQPGLSWLLFGAALATVLWWATSLLLAGYVRFSGGFGDTYGPLTGIIALLIWANLTGIALFLGLAFAAQLEAARVGAPEPAEPDRWRPTPADDRPHAPHLPSARSSKNRKSVKAARVRSFGAGFAVGPDGTHRRVRPHKPPPE